jgi:hypothetical protein
MSAWHRNRTLFNVVTTAALGHERTKCSKYCLFDHLVGEGEQGPKDGETKVFAVAAPSESVALESRTRR